MDFYRLGMVCFLALWSFSTTSSLPVTQEKGGSPKNSISDLAGNILSHPLNPFMLPAHILCIMFCHKGHSKQYYPIIEGRYVELLMVKSDDLK